jgi:hypothetical protein
MTARGRRSLRFVAGTIAAVVSLAPLAAMSDEPVPRVTVPVVVAAQAGAASGAVLRLGEDFVYRRPAADVTDVRVAQDASALLVTFEASQSEAITATQTSNGPGVLTDDYVGVYLWPKGRDGFAYSFVANARGTTYQTSSENSSYTPRWSAVASRTGGGYRVAMVIPLGAIRAGGSTAWRAQFVRGVVATGALDVWAYSAAQSSATDSSFAGVLTELGMRTSTAAAPRARGRAQFYGLVKSAVASQGGGTSRMGADFSLPVTPTASFVGTIHPDYSNVEVDQQTIAPSAFPYQYQEVRPFFSQAGQAFNHTAVSCIQCPQLLYTPAIPTFRTGYAVEGTQGPLTFSAFDAVGNGRLDKAVALDFGRSDTNRTYAVNMQNIAVDSIDGLHDYTTSLTAGYQNQRSHLFAYGFGALERGSQVSSPSSALFGQAGVGYADATSVVSLAYDAVGSQFSPVDAYVQQNDVRGYEGIVQKQLNFSPKAFVHALSVSAVATSFADHNGNAAQHLFQLQTGVDLRNLFSARVYGGRQAIKAYDGRFLPFNANGALVGYRLNTGTPSYISYAGGSFFDGSLDSWTYATTVPLKPTVHLSLEMDENKYFTTDPHESGVSQWLQRATLDWQISHDASIDLGVRRIIGGSLPNAFAPPNFAYVNATNFSAAFHLLTLRNEFYVVYGDPNALASTHAVYLKWIRYVGAPKGT